MRDATVVTLHDLVHRVSRRHEERPALCETDSSCVTYGEMRHYALAIARHLHERGIGFGDRVALIAENRPEWGLWYLGVTAAGAVILPILTDFSPNEVQRILSHAEPKLVVTSEKAAALTEGWSATPVVDCGIVRELPAPASDAAAAAPATAAPGAAEIEPDTLAALIYTSGTTGNPKGVMLSHRNLITNAQAVQEIFDVDEEDILLSVLPLAHTYECTIGFLVPLLSGASVTYLDGPPTPSRLLPALESIRPTIMLVVPLIIEKVYRSRVAPKLAKMPRAIRRFPPVRMLLHYLAGAKLKRSFGGRLEVFGIGGAPLAPDTERFLRDARFPYTIGYGLTETAPLLTGTAPFETRFRSTGAAVSGVELRIADETGGADASSVGEIQARGPNVMLGYFRNPDATAETFSDDGWFRTGDLGRMDGDGYIYVQGRLKTLIVGPSGENIYPEEIEATIETEPLVEDSLVLSEGGKLIARVRLNLDALAEQLGTLASELDPGTIAETGAQLLEDLRRSVNARLNHFSRLARMVLQIEDFERTPTRKIKRFRYQKDETSPESR
jgi:long-chain acyl-CoA synthetase